MLFRSSAAGKLAPPYVMTQTSGGELSGCCPVDTSLLIGKCPVIEVQIGGVGVACLLDTGSIVTTITQKFFEQRLQSCLQLQLQPCTWLKLKAANGLEIPYLRVPGNGCPSLAEFFQRWVFSSLKPQLTPTPSLIRSRSLAF